MGQHRRALEALAELDRDGRRRSHAALGERLGLLVDELAQGVGVEMALVPARRQEAPDGPCHGPDSGPGGRDLPAGPGKLVEELLAASLVPGGQFRQRFDGLAGHPAGYVRTVVTELVDPIFEGGRHGWDKIVPWSRNFRRRPRSRWS